MAKSKSEENSDDNIPTWGILNLQGDLAKGGALQEFLGTGGGIGAKTERYSEQRARVHAYRRVHGSVGMSFIFDIIKEGNAAKTPGKGGGAVVEGDETSKKLITKFG